MKTSKLLLSAVVACAFATSSMVANAADLTLRFANVSTKSSIDAATVLMDVADKESNGRLKIEHFPNNVLGDDRLVLESTMMGDVGMCQIATSELAPLVADMNIYDAPFLFNTPADAWKFVDSEQGKKIAAQLEERGLKLLAMLELGFRNYTNNAHPVRVPADVKGQKMRVLNSDVHIAMWKAWGANPTPMAFAELLPALQQGTVDAQENPLAIIDANKLYEVQHYISLTGHLFSPHCLYINKEIYDGLDPELRTALDKAVAAYQTAQRARAVELNALSVGKFEKAGCEVIEITDEERAQWRQMAIDGKVYDMVRSKMEHPEYLDKILNKEY